MKNALRIGILFGLLGYALPLFAATIHVPADQPTIQAGIDAASPGDTVLVADGIYRGTGNKNLDFKGKSITLESQNGAANCIIDCEDAGIGFYFHNGEGIDSVLSGFSITNSKAYNGGGIYCNNSSPNIKSCIVKGNLSTGFGGGICCVNSSPTITNCEITQNSAGIHGGGIYCQNSIATITNCTIRGNTAIASGGRGGGICCQASSNVTLINCLITGNSAIDSGGVYCNGSSPTMTNCTISRNEGTVGAGVGCVSESSPAITNCILWNNAPMEIYKDGSSGPEVSYCDVQRDYPGEGNFYADPLFLDAENGDYHLAIGSPCIYAASAVGAPDKDIEGNPRPQGYGYDIGTYEMTGYDKIRPVIESFMGNITEGYIPFEVTFTCIAHDPDGEIVNYTINYGDGSETETTSTGIFVHTYTSGGMVYVGCNVTDNAGITVYSTSMRIKRHGQIHVPSNYATIQAAIDVALDGDIVVVADGTYTGAGNKNLDFKGKNITVRSENGPQKSIIDCEGNGRGFYFHSGEGETSVVSGFTIRNGRMDRAGGISCESSSPTISKCVITKNVAYDANSGGIGCYNSSPIITDCKIADNAAFMWGGGIGCFDSAPTITKCVISGNRSQYYWGGGLVTYNASPNITNCIFTGNSASMEGGAVYFNNSRPRITNCIISKNSASEGAAVYSGYSAFPIITNSIIWENSPVGIFIRSADLDIRYSLVGGGWVGEGNIDVNPAFVDLENGDFHLKNYSPCIGAGVTIGTPATDIDGNPRPNPPGSYPDMGAYESPLAVRAAPPLDIFGMEAGNEYVYEGTSGGNPYTVKRRVGMDPTTFPISTYAYEITENGVFSGKEYYQKSSDQVLLWGASIKDAGSLYDLKFSKGLPVIRFPVVVGDHQYSSTTGEFAQFPGYTFNVSMDVLVMAQETVDLGFDTFEAYKVRYEMRVWGQGVDYTDTFFWWVVPYIGAVKDEDADSMVKLTSFAIGEGTITHQSDADRDGLRDYQELFKGQTNWLDGDTDDDGCLDGPELQGGRNPMIADPEGDVNGDCALNLADAISALRVITGAEEIGPSTKKADVNGDGRVGSEEIIWIMQKIAGLR